MYSTVQYGTVQYSTVQYSTVQYSTVQYSTVQYSTVQYSTVQYSTVQYSDLIVGTGAIGRCFKLEIFNWSIYKPNFLVMLVFHACELAPPFYIICWIPGGKQLIPG